MRMSASVSGSGTLTAGELMLNLAQIPPEAELNINTSRGDQRDGPYWSISAEWDGAMSTEETNIRTFDRGVPVETVRRAHQARPVFPGGRKTSTDFDHGQWGDH